MLEPEAIRASYGTIAVGIFLRKLIEADDGTDIEISGGDCQYGEIIMATVNDYVVAMSIHEAKNLVKAAQLLVADHIELADFILYMNEVIRQMETR